MNATLRASDTDRERVVSHLRQQVGAGRLTLDEFSDRAAAAYRTRTLGELAELTRDLPHPAPADGAAPVGMPRMLLPGFAVAVLALLLGAAILTPWLAPMAACY
jgi:hypothetical protein